ncbi:MAG: IS3 family transposase [Proteobacteria bacterium]|nr:IS3 family transposase [Desulfobulbaceae bacterium]MBU4152708.1 IS3 family transposase [Pseudomonadota bacterium]
MSCKENCWDNAPSEGFLHPLFTELTHHERYETRAEAKSNVFEYIKVFYNRQRRHAATRYLSPAVHEAAYQNAA